MWTGLAVYEKCKTEMSEAFTFAEHLFLTLISQIWPFGSEVLKIQCVGFFSPPLPLPEGKREMPDGEGGSNTETGWICGDVLQFLAQAGILAPRPARALGTGLQP